MIFQDPVTFDDITQARYEFRSGVSAGNGGALLAFGDVPVSVTDTGITAINAPVGLVEGTLSSPVELSSGDYWVSFTGHDPPINTRLLMGTTFGANGVNPSPGDDFRDDTFFSLNFASTELEPALGLMGTVIPEPASAVLLGLGGLGLIARRRRLENSFPGSRLETPWNASLRLASSTNGKVFLIHEAGASRAVRYQAGAW
jgi:hypothetical protein